MVYQSIYIFLLASIVTILTACGSSGDGANNSNSIDSGGASAGVQANITASGVDTNIFSSNLDVNFYAYREDFAGSQHYLAATSTGTALNFVRLGMGELENEDLDSTIFISEVQDAFVLIATDLGLSARINFAGESYLYSLSCAPESCSGIIFDTANRSLSLNNVSLEPALDGEGEATGLLTLDGTIVWAAKDEDPAAPAVVSIDPGVDTGSSNVTLADIVGVWDASSGGDEKYIVFQADGVYGEYDFRGDFNTAGMNCYTSEEGTVEDLGDGQFRFNGTTRVGTFSFVGEDLVFTAPEGAYTYGESDLTVSDLAPMCDVNDAMVISLAGTDVTNNLLPDTLSLGVPNIAITFVDSDPDDFFSGFRYLDYDDIEGYSYFSFNGQGLSDTSVDKPKISLALETDDKRYSYNCDSNDDLIAASRPNCSGITFEQVGDVITVVFNNTTLGPLSTSDATSPITLNGTLVKDAYE